MRATWSGARAVAFTAVALLVVVGIGTASAQDQQGASGTVRIAYPDEPVTWHPATVGSLGAVDLAALWGLPLYRVDEHGQLRAGLAAGARVVPGTEGEPWAVEVDLRPGTWSDGRPVVAQDVIATLEVLRGTRYGPTLEPLSTAAAVDDDTVRLEFDRPYGRWPFLLAGGLSVLPAHVLTTEGLEAYADGVPVSGGPFRLEAYERALRATFVAHEGSPVGTPDLERVEVYFTPSYETSLGLLRDHRVDVVMGHLALNPVDRAHRVDGIHAAAPLGGTTASVRWQPSAGGVEIRTAARAAVDVSQLIEGLLGSAGAALTSTIPGHDGPWSPRGAGATDALDGLSIDLLVPDHQEVPAFTARVLQRDLRGAGAEMALVRVPPEDVVGPDPRTADGALVVHRQLPRPSQLAPSGSSDGAMSSLTAADAAASNLSPEVDAATDALHAEAFDLPLYQVGVAHAWRVELGGVQPSAWPGLAWWDVASWRWVDQTPPQEPTLGSTDASD